MSKKKKIKLIPPRLLLSAVIFCFETLAIIGIVVALCYYVPKFYSLALITQIACIIKIVASDDNPDYKIPWLLVVFALPVAGFMLYFIFSSRKLKKRFIKRLKDISNDMPIIDDSNVSNELKSLDITAFNQLKMASTVSFSHIYDKTETVYFSDIDKLKDRLLYDLEKAKNFIFLEFFIIEEGFFWNSIKEVLVKKASLGVDVRLVYDDIGCMFTLPSKYFNTLQKQGIKAIPFSRLRGSADSEFNNRNHRKIVVIDGEIGYTGGFNLADEYLNKVQKFGYWKDAGIRIVGGAVAELTKLFFIDYGINAKRLIAPPNNAYKEMENLQKNGYLVPFGDGPKPLYKRQVSKSIIQNMLSSAKNYVYVTTPYLIIDNDLLTDIENTALRGVKVKIVLPAIPDKKLVFLMSRSYYFRLISAGVEIYEYTPGFIHAKTYLVDGDYAMVGTVNLDYRSLVHHFENGVLMYKTSSISDIEKDFLEVEKKSKLIDISTVKNGIIKRFISSIVRIFSPLL